MISRDMGAARAGRLAFLPVIAACLLSSRAEALDPARDITQYVVSRWSTEHGLPQNSVESIVQTRDGYLWLGTLGGLVRFDGARFALHKNKRVAEASAMRHLFVDSDGAIWMATHGSGVWRIAGDDVTEYTEQSGMGSNIVFATAEGKDGTRWFATYGGGVSRLRGNEITTITSKHGLSSDVVWVVHVDRKGTLWIGTEAGLARWQEQDARVRVLPGELAGKPVRAIAEDARGNIWVGTDGNGLFQVTDDRVVHWDEDTGAPTGSVRSLHVDSHDTLWIGSRGAGLFRLGPDRTFQNLSTKEGLANDIVTTIFEDREGSLWIGTRGGGLTQLRDGKFVGVTTTQGLPSNMIWSIYEDKKGELWIGTHGGGLSHWSGGEFRNYRAQDGLSNESVWSVHESRSGDIWIGTWGGGLNRLRNGVFTSFREKDGLPNDSIRVLLEDRAGDLWIGTDGDGLARLRNGKFAVYTTKDGLPHNVVRALHEDKGGTLWIGTGGGGVASLAHGKFSVISNKDGLSSNIITAIHEDKEGVLWLGTRGGGLNRLKGGQVASFTTGEGLFDNDVFQVLEDDHERLWMSSNRGVFRVDKKQLDELAGGLRSSIESISYGERDGMKNSECNGWSQPAGVRTKDGKLWFPTVSGIVTIDPNHIRKNDIMAPVFIEEISIDDEVFDPSSDIAAPPGSGELKIRYTALSLRVPERVRFRYKLEGFETDWVDAATRRTAFYTNVPPGAYRFRVVASNDSGLWNEVGAALALRIEPRFHQTMIFYLLCALLAVGLSFGVYRLRTSRLRSEGRRLGQLIDERTRELQSSNEELDASLCELKRTQSQLVQAGRMAAVGTLVAGISHELNTPLTVILGNAQSTLKRTSDDNPMRKAHEAIERQARRCVRLVRSLLSFSRTAENVHQESPKELLLRVAELSEGPATRAGVTLDLVFPDEDLPKFFVTSREIESAIVNVVHNSIDATAKGDTVTVTTTRKSVGHRDGIEFVIEDTGAGISTDILDRVFDPFFTTKDVGSGTGLGLSLARQIIEAHSGVIELQSVANAGTCVTIFVPLGDEGS